MTEDRFGVPEEASSSTPSDAEVIERLKADDARALELLLATHWAALLRYAEGVLGGVGDPQDVVQEGFIRLWNRRAEWNPDGSIKALLYTMTRNAALDQRRRRVRSGRLDPRADTQSAGSSPYEDVQGAELQRAAAAAVSNLPPKRQEVFRLARDEGLSYRDIAQVMGISEQTVANQMSLALADLRVALKPFISDRIDTAGSERHTRKQ